MQAGGRVVREGFQEEVPLLLLLLHFADAHWLLCFYLYTLHMFF